MRYSGRALLQTGDGMEAGNISGVTLTEQSPTVLVEEIGQVCEVLRFCELNISADPTKHSLNRWFVLVLAQTSGGEFFTTICRKSGKNEKDVWFIAPSVSTSSFELAAEKFIYLLRNCHYAVPWRDETLSDYLPVSESA